jgi:hypothetical protein
MGNRKIKNGKILSLVLGQVLQEKGLIETTFLI